MLNNPLNAEWPTASTYAQDYVDWKNWSAFAFGSLTAEQARYLTAEIKRTRRVFGPQSRILKIGFGNGNFLAYARNQGWNITGTELNEDLIKTATLNNYAAIPADALYSLPPASFDLVAAFDVLEHVPQENLLAFLRTVQSILKPSGCFIARFPNADSPMGLINQNGDITHVTSLGSGKVYYFASKLELNLVFLGGESEIIKSSSPQKSLRQFISYIAKSFINLGVRAVFQQKNYCSRNLVAIFQKPNESNIQSD